MTRLRLPITAALFTASVALVSGCTRKPGQRSLVLFCGAGIRNAAEPLIEAFRKKTGVGIDVTYGGGGRLLGQITAAQAGDLFMPGAEFYVDRAIETGHALADTKRVVGYFVPVIFVQKGNPKSIASLEDLLREGVRLGIGDERACAVGKKARAILEKNNIDMSAIEKQVVYTSGTVDALGVAIKLGTIDATIVWDVTARNFADSGTTVRIPTEANLPSMIPVVVLNSSQRRKDAQRFVEFATSAEGREVVRTARFSVELEAALGW